jgi:hypothetical protein
MPVKPLLSREDWERFDSYAELFAGETDRGAAVLAGSYLGSLLEDLLRAKLVPGDYLKSLFSDANGPLGTFYSRITLAYALGLLPPEVQHDLHLVRKIRNKFAHHPEMMRFQTRPVSDWCRELDTTRFVARYFRDPAEAFAKNARGQFVLAVQIAMFQINRVKYDAEPFQPTRLEEGEGKS